MTNREIKRERWLKVAPKRVEKMKHDYMLMTNMLNTTAYTYTKDELKQVLEALERAHEDFVKAYQNAIDGKVAPKRFHF